MLSRLWPSRRVLPETTVDEARAELSASDDWRVLEAMHKLLPVLAHPSQLALDQTTTGRTPRQEVNDGQHFFIGGEPGLLYLAREGFESCAMCILRADILSVEQCNAEDCNGYTALHFAALNRQAELVRELSLSGIDATARGR